MVCMFDLAARRDLPSSATSMSGQVLLPAMLPPALCDEVKCCHAVISAGHYALPLPWEQVAKQEEPGPDLVDDF
jgi:hypothetical protein